MEGHVGVGLRAFRRTILRLTCCDLPDVELVID